MNSVVFTLPGLYNSGPEHWQTHWENEHGLIRIQQKDWNTPECEDWINTIDAVVTQHPLKQVILVAHSAACCAVAYWAEKYKRKIKGALLVAPADPEAAIFPTGNSGFQPISLQPLGFPSVLVASTNDEYVSLERARYFADRWGSEFTFLCKAGHINSASNLGNWPAGFELLQQLDK
jgi:uncharacterized protein